MTWLASPLDELASLNGYANSGRFNPLLFSERGLVPLGYAAFAFTLGAAAGAVLRRTVPAMALTLAGLAAARLAVTYWLRVHLEPAAHLALPLKPFLLTIGITPGGPYLHMTLPPNVQNAWVLSDQVVNAAGHPAPVRAYVACGAPGTAAAQRLPRPVRRSLPPGAHLAARQPVLAVPGLRDRHLRRGGTPSGRRLLVVAAPPPRLTMLAPAAAPPITARHRNEETT